MAVINNSKYIMLLRGNKGKGRGKEKMKKTEYLKTVQVDFEGLKVNAPGCWDKYLTNLYGDYMRLPPEEQRLTHDMEIGL